MRERLYKTYAEYMRLRNENEVFRSPNTTVDFWLNDLNGRKRIRLMHPSMNVTIVGNFGVVDQVIDTADTELVQSVPSKGSPL